MEIPVQQRDVGIAYLLWFFLGGFGGHRFYLGRKGSAIGQLALNLLGWLTFWMLGLGFLFWIALGIWWIVDAFLIPGMVRDMVSQGRKER
ncbi:MAG: TM2 domain-containing protein [Alicyclobacillaceae bacterium]|nr:TM2 domain-containing protein [Alicyclobacillaceae bacterium]